jgi:diguanylate cyclase (GGDEF)-like protein/PAS domain S-box-containing protein
MTQKPANEDLKRVENERSQPTQELREKEEKYRTILDGIEDSYLEVDLGGNFQFFNASFCRLLGYSKDELLGRNNQEFVDKVNTEKIFQIFHNVYLTGKPAEGIEWEVVRKDGSKRLIEASVSLATDSEGKPIGFRGIGRDVTERKRTLERTIRLNRLNERLLSPSSLNEKLKLITDEVVNAFNADFARIWIITSGDLCDSGCTHAKVTKGKHACRDRDRCLHLMASSGRYTHIDGGHKRVPFGCYKIGRVAAEKEPKFLTNAVINEPRIHDSEWAKKFGLVSFAGYRLLAADGGVLGVLALFSKNSISPEEDAQLESLAGTTAHIIHRKLADETLRESEEKLRAIFNASPVAIVLIGRDGRVLDSNEEQSARLNMTPSQIIGKCIWDLLPESVRNHRKKLTEKVFELGKPVSGEDEREGLWNEYHIYPAIKNEKGEVEAVLVQAINISKRKQAEEEIRILASTDSLTGTNNRRSFMEQAETEWNRCRRYRHSMSILMIDVDHFKSINDIYGHHIGDLTLQLLTKTCLEMLRENDIFGRIGGEEFAAVLVEIDEEKAIEVAERLRKILSDLTVKEDSISFNFQVSIGVANLTEDDESVMDVIKKADRALYKAKRLGRNMVIASSELS